MKNTKEGFEVYHGYHYRVCYRLKGGKMDYSVPYYEFHKFCKCELCSKRARKRKAINNLTITTKEKSKFGEIATFLENWECDKQVIDNSAFAVKHIEF